MHTLMVYSEAGGVAKTTTAVSLAMSWAEQGRQVVLIDLDPRAAATKWVDVEPTEPGLHIGAVIGNPDPTGWIQDLAVPSGDDDPHAAYFLRRRASFANSTVERRTDSNSSDTNNVSTIANGSVVATAPRPYSRCHDPGWMVNPRA